MFGKGKTQKEKVKQLIGLTHCSESTANLLLRNHQWNLEAAANAFFSDLGTEAVTLGRAASDDYSEARLSQLFEQYKDSTEDKILVEGTERYCADLEVQPDDVVMLVIATHLKAKMCEFGREGFMNGWRALRCDTIEKMHAALPRLRDELSRPDTFKPIYEYTFGFGLGPMQRSLPLEVALPLWQLLLDGRFSKLEMWFTFVQEVHGKSIPRDTWNMLLEFINTVDDDTSNYDMNDPWPSLIDEFVAYYRKQQEN